MVRRQYLTFKIGRLKETILQTGGLSMYNRFL
jgi:hypothetical protein